MPGYDVLRDTLLLSEQSSSFTVLPQARTNSGLHSHRDAWSSQHGLSRTEAKRRYISTLITTMHKYASTTPEARELVAELEFVWDQIKSNSTSSSSSSPGQKALGPSQLQQQQNPSYASIGPERARDEGGGGLRMIKPVSEQDDEEEDGEELDETGDNRDNNVNDNLIPKTPGAVRPRDYEIRNRKWRKRIELAIFKMTTEIAALREQLEAKRTVGAPRQRRRGLWAWMVWLAWAAAKHVVVDAALLGVALLWARRKDDRRLEEGVRVLVRILGEWARKVGVVRMLRVSAQRTQTV